MKNPEETRWTMVQAAARGEAAARVEFARRYLPVVRAYLHARWRRSPLRGEVEDAAQEVFVDCFHPRGALARLERERTSSFRAFFYGVVRNSALHVETRRAREHARRPDSTFEPEGVPAREEALSRIFDRAWARSLIKEATRIQLRKARAKGGAAVRRTEILRLRFHEGLAIRDIARAWKVNAARLHHDYAQARKEFLDALREVVGLEQTSTKEELDLECGRILELLG